MDKQHTATNVPTAFTVLGAGGPHPYPGHFGSSIVISHDDSALMVDCGPGTTYKMPQHSMTPVGIDGLLITHHHFDHTADVAALLMARWEGNSGSHTPAQIVGPSPTQAFVDALVGPQGAYRPDIDARREAPLSQAKYEKMGGTLPRPNLETEVHELEPGDSLVLNGIWDVSTARPVHVQPFHESLAYRIEVGSYAFVITGDTEYCEDVTHLAQGADVLFAMCTDEEERFQSRGFLVNGQMGTGAVGRMAAEAEVRAVVLMHTSFQITQPVGRQRAVREVSAQFDGDILFGEEGLSVQMPI